MIVDNFTLGALLFIVFIVVFLLFSAAKRRS